MERQSSDLNAFWQSLESTWSNSTTKVVKYVPCKVINKGMKENSLAGLSILIALESTISARPTYSQALWSQKCYCSLIYRPTQEATMLPTGTAKPKKSIGTEEPISLVLPVEYYVVFCFDLFIGSLLPRIMLFFSTINLRSDCCKHATVEVTAVSYFVFWEDLALHSTE